MILVVVVGTPQQQTVFVQVSSIIAVIRPAIVTLAIPFDKQGKALCSQFELSAACKGGGCHVVDAEICVHSKDPQFIREVHLVDLGIKDHSNLFGLVVGASFEGTLQTINDLDIQAIVDAVHVC